MSKTETNTNTNTKTKIRIVVNICIVVMAFGAWMYMTMHGKGSLSLKGFRNLKYFTIQSNILAGSAAAVWLANIRKAGESGAGMPAWVERLKYVAAAAVGLTFTTVMVFLGPLYGYPAMFKGPSLFLHLITPLAAMAEILLLSDFGYTKKDNNLVVIPTLLYAVFYLGNIAINGIGESPHLNDWYSFLTWGNAVGALIFITICLVTWLIGLLLRKGKK